MQSSQTWCLAQHSQPVENNYPCRRVKWCGLHHVFQGSVPNFPVVQMGLSPWKECQLRFGLSFAKNSWLRCVSGNLFIDYRSDLHCICNHTIKTNLCTASSPLDSGRFPGCIPRVCSGVENVTNWIFRKINSGKKILYIVVKRNLYLEQIDAFVCFATYIR